MDQRLQKILSAGGVCSRRKAEEYLREGRVTVNGVPAALGDKADPETDTIALDGVPVGRTETRTLLMLYKPRGVVTTLADEKGRGQGVARGAAGSGLRGAAAPDR